MSGKTPYQKWYEKNKDTMNSARKAKYHSDPQYREEIISKQRAARQKNPTPSRVGASRIKMVNGVPTETFRISEVAEAIGRSVQTIRLWESKGWVPKPTVNSQYRFYTQNQLALLRELADVIALNRHEPSAVYEEVLKVKRGEILARWAL